MCNITIQHASDGACRRRRRGNSRPAYETCPIYTRSAHGQQSPFHEGLRQHVQATQFNAWFSCGKNLGKQSALADKTPIGLTDACMHTDTMTDMMPVNCNVRHRRGFCQCCYIFSGRMQKEPLCTIQPQTAIGTDTLSRNKVHPKSLKTGHDILLARRQSRHDPRCPTEIHPPYLQQQETRLPQHTENATCHCAVQSTHSQPEPEPA